MNLEDQVTSLELSKRLKELGVKQKSIFYWFSSKYNKNYLICSADEFPLLNEDTLYCHSGGCGCCADYQSIEEIYSAFTVDELLKILPARYKKENLNRYFYLTIKKYPENYTVGYNDYGTQWYLPIQIEEESLSDALAKMLIYLIENRMIKND